MNILYSVGGSALILKSQLPREQVSYDPSTVQCNEQTGRIILSVFSSITTIFFAFGGHNIALEIQSILPHPPSTVKPKMSGSLHVQVSGLLLPHLAQAAGPRRLRCIHVLWPFRVGLDTLLAWSPFLTT